MPVQASVARPGKTPRDRSSSVAAHGWHGCAACWSRGPAAATIQRRSATPAVLARRGSSTWWRRSSARRVRRSGTRTGLSSDAWSPGLVAMSRWRASDRSLRCCGSGAQAVFLRSSLNATAIYGRARPFAWPLTPASNGSGESWFRSGSHIARSFLRSSARTPSDSDGGRHTRTPRSTSPRRVPTCRARSTCRVLSARFAAVHRGGRQIELPEVGRSAHGTGLHGSHRELNEDLTPNALDALPD